MLRHANATAVIGPSVQEGVARLWPRRKHLAPDKPVSLKELARRFDEAGAQLRAFEQRQGPGEWPWLSRKQVADSVRSRLRDPAIMNQHSTGLCGPISILFELAQRNPAEYVRAAAQLFDDGEWVTPTGRKIVTHLDMRQERVPKGMPAADWLIASTMRDDENWIEDVDGEGEANPFGTGYNGLETLTWPLEMKYWTEDILQLSGDVDDCWAAGELDALRAGDRAVQNGGVAFLCIDARLLKHEPGDNEEDMWFSVRSHSTKGIGKWSPKRHSTDDSYVPTHWVPLTGRVIIDEAGAITAPVWSWAAEYLVTGSAESFTEYLYFVVIGRR